MGCPDCDFCETNEDGVLVCVIFDEQVHGSYSCECWQREFRKVDGDSDWDREVFWPAQKKRKR